MYDPNSNMLPSPNRGKRRTCSSSPRLPNLMHQGSNHCNSPRFSSQPNSRSVIIYLQTHAHLTNDTYTKKGNEWKVRTARKVFALG